MNKSYFRLNLSDDEFVDLKSNLDFNKVGDSLKEKIENPIEIKVSDKKIKSTINATKSKIKKVKEKIENAINILRMENKKITYYSISQTSKVSYLTVKKYLNDDILKTLNMI